jgi:hypothetical protein
MGQIGPKIDVKEIVIGCRKRLMDQIGPQIDVKKTFFLLKIICVAVVRVQCSEFRQQQDHLGP